MFHKGFILILLLCVCVLVYLKNGLKSSNDKTIRQNTRIFHNLFRNKSKELKPKEIRKLIARHNSAQRIFNHNINGKNKKFSITILILAYENSTNLKYLIHHLSLVKGIDQSLVIFSHKYYNAEINRIIRKIDFCQVMQIFYPFSVQAYPNEFPGIDPNDCEEYFDIHKAEMFNCNSALYSDIKGHFRNAYKAEKKHHWWWSANTVFETLNCTDLVLFLEEIAFMSEDSLHLLTFMRKLVQGHVIKSDMFNLGMIPIRYENPNNFCKIEMRSWNPKYFLGLAFNRNIWNSISSQYDNFCNIDDHSWLNSLYYISMNRKDGERFKTLATVFPRVLSTNICNLHEHETHETIENVYKNLKKIHSDHRCYNFSVSVLIEDFNKDDIMIDYLDYNGGWSDPRDKDLCLNMTVDKLKKTTLDMKIELENSKYVFHDKETFDFTYL